MAVAFSGNLPELFCVAELNSDTFLHKLRPSLHKLDPLLSVVAHLIILILVYRNVGMCVHGYMYA